MKLREKFDVEMWQARVFRAAAVRKPSERVFWLKSAIEHYQRARVVRDLIRGAS